MQLAEKATNLRTLAYSENTLRSRKSQWNKYITFCLCYNLTPLPAGEDQVCNYIAYLTESLKFSSIQNYMSGLNYFQKLYGFEPIDFSSFIISQTLRGAKRLLGNPTKAAPLLTPEDLKSIFSLLDMSRSCDLCFWCAILTCFRALLRISHVTDSHMNLYKNDFSFYDWGIMIRVSKTKTIQYAERVLQIPVYSVGGCIFDLSYYLRLLFDRMILSGTDMAFAYWHKGRKVLLTYSFFSQKLKNVCALLDLPKATSHSLRRSGASYLFRLRHDLVTIKQRGDWKSLSVLLYLSETTENTISRDKGVAISLSHL